MPCTHPTRLSLALNYSVYYSELGNNPSKAIYIAKKAFDQAIEKID